MLQDIIDLVSHRRGERHRHAVCVGILGGRAISPAAQYARPSALFRYRSIRASIICAGEMMQILGNKAKPEGAYYVRDRRRQRS